MATNDAGDVVIVGEFDEDLVIGSQTLVSAGSTDIFVAKFSSDGEPIWSRRGGGWAKDAVFDVAFDPSGNVLVTGRFSFGQAEFGGPPVFSNGRDDVFLVAYDGTDGAHLWTRSFGGPEADAGHGLVVTPAGSVVLAAAFQDSASFGGKILSSAGSYDMALASYDVRTGAHLWSVRYGGEGGDLPWDIALGPGDEISVAGNFVGTTNMGSGTLTSTGQTDAFVATFSSRDGSPRWSRSIGGIGLDSSRAVAFDPGGDLIVAGTFMLGPVDFGGRALVSLGYADIFLAKLDPGGSFVWARRYGGSADDSAGGVAVDEWGNIAMIGSFPQTADFGGGTLESAGQDDVVIAEYSPDGEHLWSSRYGSVFEDKGSDLVFSPDGDLVVTGHAVGDIDFGGGLLSDGFVNAYLARLAPPLPPPPTPSGDTFNVSGRVTYYGNGRPVPSANVRLGGPQTRNAQTALDGSYALASVARGTWTIAPSKVGDFGDAVGSLDAVYVLQATTGLRQLDEYERLACDVTGNGELSSLDAARILQLSVGALSRFPAGKICGSDWLFIPTPARVANQTVTEPAITGNQCQTGSIEIDPLTANAGGQSFQALLIGDCTGNWSSALGAARQATAGDGSYVLRGRSRRTRRGRIRLPVYVQAAAEFHAVEVVVRYDAEKLRLVRAVASDREATSVVAHSSDGTGRARAVLASAEPLSNGRVMILEFAGETASAHLPRLLGGSVDERPAQVARHRRLR